jgi:hypothetical protein
MPHRALFHLLSDGRCRCAVLLSAIVSLLALSGLRAVRAQSANKRHELSRLQHSFVIALQHSFIAMQQFPIRTFRVEERHERRNPMVQLLRSIFAVAATAAALVIAAAGTPTLADEYVTNLGPVRPNEPILASFSGQRFLAFFVPEQGSCAVHTFMWKDAGSDEPYTTTRVRLSLRPGEMVRFDNVRLSLNLLCGVDASNLAVVPPTELLLTSNN